MQRRNDRKLIRNPLRQNLRKDMQIVHLLQELVDQNKTQVQGTTPRVPDPERIILSPARLVTMERNVQLSSITLSTAPLDTFGAYAIRLSDLPSSSELVTTFDDYRILQLEFVFTPTADVNFSGSLVTVVDYDTNTAPTAVNDLLQYKSCQITESGTTCIRRLTPRVVDAVYSGAFTSYGLQTSPWIATDSSSVFHYGLRWAIAGVTGQSSNTVMYNVWCRAVLQFRNTR
jgi:hypothetical protein